jgi:ribulose-5-phosphate 4-epimerase/fuculose-1-phosphate aldolase
MRGGPPLAELLDGCAILEGERLTTAFGHLSVVFEDGTALVSSNMGLGLVHWAEDVLHVGFDGTLIEGEPQLIPGELPVHLGLLRAGWTSVARLHGPAVLAWGSLNRPLPATIGLAMFCGAAVPCYDRPRSLTRIPAGETLAARAADGPAAAQIERLWRYLRHKHPASAAV